MFDELVKIAFPGPYHNVTVYVSVNSAELVNRCLESYGLSRTCLKIIYKSLVYGVETLPLGAWRPPSANNTDESIVVRLLRSMGRKDLKYRELAYTVYEFHKPVPFRGVGLDDVLTILSAEAGRLLHPLIIAELVGNIRRKFIRSYRDIENVRERILARANPLLIRADQELIRKTIMEKQRRRVRT